MTRTSTLVEIELYLLKTLALQDELRIRLISHGSTRSTLEVATDSLIERYLSQANPSTLAAAARMGEFYKLFYTLENEIRDLIDETMVEVAGPDWFENRVPQIVRENVKKNKGREEAEGIPPRSANDLSYTTFGELGEIVKENWDCFAGIFSNASKGRVLRVINRLNLARGPIAHSNLLPDEEVVRLKLTMSDWYSLME